MAKLSDHSLRSLYVSNCERYKCRVNNTLLELLPDEKGRTDLLTEIDLNMNLVGRRGVMPVVELAQHCDKLHRLCLADNFLNNESIKHLVDTLTDHPALSHLDLRRNPISHKAGKMLAALARSNTTLQTVLLDDTLINPALVRIIEDTASANGGGGAKRPSSAPASGRPTAPASVPPVPRKGFEPADAPVPTAPTGPPVAPPAPAPAAEPAPVRSEVPSATTTSGPGAGPAPPSATPEASGPAPRAAQAPASTSDAPAPSPELLPDVGSGVQAMLQGGAGELKNLEQCAELVKDGAVADAPAPAAPAAAPAPAPALDTPLTQTQLLAQAVGSEPSATLSMLGAAADLINKWKAGEAAPSHRSGKRKRKPKKKSRR
eukprot:Hpha_TRINITY_DN2789_c0_g1::TRINITY_DN2789_c0_g1_i1::g.110330::m.110330